MNRYPPGRVALEHRDNALLHVAIEVNHHVAAEDHGKRCPDR
jgi:hypothetical protein